MATITRIIIAAAAGVVLSAGAVWAAETQNPDLCFELIDGTVITGRIDSKTIDLRISSGNVVKIPLAAFKELTVGLNDRGGVNPRVETLIKLLDSNKTRKNAMRELIAIGPSMTHVIKRHYDKAAAERRWALWQILQAYQRWSTDHPDQPEAMSRPPGQRSTLKVGMNTFYGSVIAKEHQVASPYGKITVKLADILRIRQSAPFVMNKIGRWNVRLRDGTHLRCSPLSKSIRLQTRYRVMIVPCDRIQQANFSIDGKNIRLRCRNSDQIAGAMASGATISLKTDRGKMDLSPGKIGVAAYGPVTLRGHLGYVTSVAFSPDGKRLASASYDKTIKLWNLAAGTELLTLKGHSDVVWFVAFSPDGKRLASGSSDKTVKLWDAATGKALLTLKGHRGDVRSVAFLPDGRRLTSGSGDGSIRLWDAIRGNEQLSHSETSGRVSSVAYSPNGKQLAFAGGNGYIVHFWNIGIERFRLKGHLHWVTFVAFSPDGKQLASASYDKTIRLWGTVAGKKLLSLKGHSSLVTSVAFSPGGKRLASGSEDKTIKLWDTVTGKELLTLKGDSGLVYWVAFSPDGKQLASAGTDKRITVWNISHRTKAAK